MLIKMKTRIYSAPAVKGVRASRICMLIKAAPWYDINFDFISILTLYQLVSMSTNIRVNSYN